MRPQEKYTRSNVSQFVELSPWVQILDVPVPQMVDVVTFFKQFLVEPDDSQVIDVPRSPWMTAFSLELRYGCRR